MLRVNIFSLTQLTKLFLKKMLENKSGKIMNVASGAAFSPIPLFSVYAATKAYVLHFSDALANEVAGTGVSVTCFCPAATRSRFYERANAEDSKLAKGRLMDSARAARIGYAALKKGKVVTVAGISTSLMCFAPRLAPRSLVTKISRSFVERA
jgi:short-subunit dehydrogenase